MSLEEIIIACKKNNREAQNLLYRRYKNTLFLLSLKYCKNTAEAEDTLHDAFIIIFSKMKSYSNKGSFEGWMKRIVINKAIDKYKNKKEIPVEINDEILEDVTLRGIEIEIPLDAILKFIQELPNQYRLVFSLYELDGYSHSEIAKMLNITESTSKSNLHRAKVNLKERILIENKKSNYKSTP